MRARPTALAGPKLGAKAEVARELCYRLYTLCERKKRAAEALSYNGVGAELARDHSTWREKNQKAEAEQTSLFASEDA